MNTQNSKKGSGAIYSLLGDEIQKTLNNVDVISKKPINIDDKKSMVEMMRNQNQYQMLQKREQNDE